MRIVSVLPPFNARPGLALALVLLSASSATAQLPEEFTNLQFFPEDITQAELVGQMRSFAFALGVRCTHCHMGEEGQPFSTYDFASDDKAAKRKARAMLEMVEAINSTHLAALPERADPETRVRCATCHGGLAIPRSLGEELRISLDADGTDAAVGRYRELREAYFGRRLYDFGEQTLVELADGLFREDRADAAVALLELNLEFLPRSLQSLVSLGQIHERTGDAPRAAERYRQALEIAPGNAFIQQRLEAVGGGGTP